MANVQFADNNIHQIQYCVIFHSAINSELECKKKFIYIRFCFYREFEGLFYVKKLVFTVPVFVYTSVSIRAKRSRQVSDKGHCNSECYTEERLNLKRSVSQENGSVTSAVL